MKKLIPVLLPLVIAGCQQKTASVAPPPVPPLNPVTPAHETVSSNSTSSVGTGAQTASASLGSVTNTKLTDLAGKQDYFPMADGNTWIFDGEIQSKSGDGPARAGTAELIFKLSEVKHFGDKTQALLTVWQGDQPVDRSLWQEGPDGIYQLSSGVANNHFDKPEPIMHFPVKGEQVFTWSNSGTMPDGHHGTQTGRTVVTNALQIDTANGTVQGVESAATQHFTSDAGSGSATTSTWFQPGVGIVRFVQALDQKGSSLKSILRLKSWTIQQH